ncbi:MAG: flagellar type III secretion system pore protein FliP [Clostridiales bacterium]|jgi:flagellar biosynthetic protein FliP|nr:flagellar type III secretion system pore protein FliP [Clostridiales bacterium]
MKYKKFFSRAAIFAVVFAAVLVYMGSRTSVLAVNVPNIDISITNGEGAGQTSSALQILFLFVLIALLPTILLMMTSFLRIIIVLHFLRTALGTQSMPPNQVMIGIALIMTLFIMSGPLDRIWNEAFVPFQSGEISAEEFSPRLMEPLREFMYKQVDPEDLGLFGNHVAELGITYETPLEEIPNTVLIPAFVLSELTAGFWAGFWLYVAFIVIDMVVASVLMAMGMMMLPPAMISMPFKIVIFVMSDGWKIVVDAIISGFVR